MESNPIDLGITQNRLSLMKYSQLRKAAKRYSITANQKKEVLIMELSKVWNHRECNKENIAPSKVAKSKVALSCSPKGSLNDTFNQTFTIEQDSGDMKPCAEKIATNEDSVEKESILQRTQEMNFVCLVDSSSNPKMKQNRSTSCKNKSVAPGELIARFAALHQKLVQKQPTLQEADANVKRKFAEHEKAVPNIFKRLATPKFSKNAKSEMEVAMEITGHKFKNADEDPSKMNFSFPKLYGTKSAFTAVQNNSNIASQSKIALPRRPRMLEIGVKELTKRFNTKQVRRSARLAKLTKHTNSVTVPQLSTRLQRLATPKGKNSEVSLTESEEKMLRRHGRRYVPYRRMIPYVDTTKMTDNQFHEAKMLGQIQTLTAVSTSRTKARQQLRLKRDKTREQILKTKRGC